MIKVFSSCMPYGGIHISLCQSVLNTIFFALFKIHFVILKINLSFIERLVSTCKIANNSICDDGENILLDRDCDVIFKDSSKDSIIYTMWIIRLTLIIGILLFIIKNPNWIIAVIFLIALLILNGAFGEIHKATTSTVINDTRNYISTATSSFSTNIHNVINTIQTKYPAAGIIAIGAVIWLLFVYFPTMRKVKR